MTRVACKITVWFIAVAISSAACQPGQESVKATQTQPVVNRFERAGFACTDSIRGVWRVSKYTLFHGDDHNPAIEPNAIQHICFSADAMWYYGADTLLYKQYVQIERLTPSYPQPKGYSQPFTYRFDPAHENTPTRLYGYYGRLHADSLFLVDSYEDGPDFWLLRDCP